MADGSIDGRITVVAGGKIWDYAAGCAIAEAAGGVARRLNTTEKSLGALDLMIGTTAVSELLFDVVGV